MVHETKFSLKISYSTHVCLAQLDRHQTCEPVMVSCEFNYHWRQLYLLRHLDANFVQTCQKCQICVIYENLDCLFGKMLLCHINKWRSRSSFILVTCCFDAKNCKSLSLTVTEIPHSGFLNLKHVDIISSTNSVLQIISLELALTLSLTLERKILVSIASFTRVVSISVNTKIQIGSGPIQMCQRWHQRLRLEWTRNKSLSKLFRISSID